MSSLKRPPTPREREVVKLLAEGKTQRQIALHLGTTHKTIYSMLGQVRKKTNSVTDRMLILKFQAGEL